MKTLKDIFTEVIADYNGASFFSAHDVTMAIRAKINASTDSFDLKIIKVGDKHLYDVDHQAVKTLIEAEFAADALNRKYTGAYFEYSIKSPYKTIVQNVQAALPAPIQNNVIKLRGFRPLVTQDAIIYAVHALKFGTTGTVPARDIQRRISKKFDAPVAEIVRIAEQSNRLYVHQGYKHKALSYQPIGAV